MSIEGHNAMVSRGWARVLWPSVAVASGLWGAAMAGDLPPPPVTTSMGALVNHITGGADAKTFQPMNVNFGLYPPLDEMRGGRKGRKDRYPAYTDRAKADFNQWLAGQN